MQGVVTALSLVGPPFTEELEDTDVEEDKEDPSPREFLETDTKNFEFLPINF